MKDKTDSSDAPYHSCGCVISGRSGTDRYQMRSMGIPKNKG